MSDLSQEQQGQGSIRHSEPIDVDDGTLNTGITPEGGAAKAVVVPEIEEDYLGAYCVSEGDGATDELQRIADGARQIGELYVKAPAKVETINQIGDNNVQPPAQPPAKSDRIDRSEGSDIHRIGDGKPSNEHSSDEIQKARRNRDVLDRLNKLAPEGIFRLDNGRSSLAGADLRGADLSHYQHDDGSRGYKIEVPKRGAKGETEIVPLGEWLAKANKDELEAIVPGMVYTDKEDSEFYATNFGESSGAAIKNLNKYSKPFDGSPIDIMKDFSRHQLIDPDQPIYEDRWNSNPEKNLLSAGEYHHKMAIEDKILLDENNPHLAEMDQYVKAKMADQSAVDRAIVQMVDGLMKPGRDYTIPEGVDEDADRAAMIKKERDAILAKEFGDETHKNSQLEKFFCGSFISEWASRSEIKEAVNKEFNAFTNPMEREEHLKKAGFLKDVSLDELCGKCGGWIVPDMNIYNDARRKLSGLAPEPEGNNPNEGGAQGQPPQPPQQQP